MGLKSGWFLTMIPYSVSIPMTFGMAMRPSPLSAERNPPGRTAREPGGLGGTPRPPQFIRDTGRC